MSRVDRVDQQEDRALTESQRDWLRVRNHLRQHRGELGHAAAQEYPGVPRVAGTDLLTRPEWLPAEPIPLAAIDLEFAPDTPFTGLSGTDPCAAAVCPLRPDGARYLSYSTTMADLAAPTVFENRSTYRLLDADLSGPRGRLVFGRGRYFDGIDLGEAAAHEYAAARLAGAQLAGGRIPLRTAIGDPCDLTRRPANLAVSALTIRRDRTGGAAGFLLHWRDPAKVGHAGGLYMVVPVGIFQATSDQPENERTDFSLWRCLVREYAEELLGEPEDHTCGQAPLDYGTWPFAARMTDALRSGRISAHVLGLGVDPLTFATDLLTVVVFDAPLFDELFAGMVDHNAEGRLVGPAANGTVHPGVPFTGGFPFTVDHVRRMLEQYPMQAAGAATLALAALLPDAGATR